MPIVFVPAGVASAWAMGILLLARPAETAKKTAKQFAR
jgi:hypothetical protein